MIRELFETERCANDALKNVRVAYVDAVGKSTLQAIVNFEPTPDQFSQERCAQAIIHYHSWTRDVLVRQLSWPDFAFYHTVYRAERTLAVLGILGSTWITIRTGRQG